MNKGKDVPFLRDTEESQEKVCLFKGEMFKIKVRIECPLYHNQGIPMEVSNMLKYLLQQEIV